MVKPPLGQAQTGDTFTVLDFRRGFVKVMYQGRVGWIHVNAFIKTEYTPPPPVDHPGGNDGVATGPKG
jgi:hypothetical protein